MNTGKLCPTGWHVPSDVEWTTLSTYLDDEDFARGEMKSVSGWGSLKVWATNSSGFSGLPGGNRDFNISFFGIGDFGHWWSFMEILSANAWYRYIIFDYASIDRYNDAKSYGFSIRCVRDN